MRQASDKSRDEPADKHSSSMIKSEEGIEVKDAHHRISFTLAVCYPQELQYSPFLYFCHFIYEKNFNFFEIILMSLTVSDTHI